MRALVLLAGVAAAGCAHVDAAGQSAADGIREGAAITRDSAELGSKTAIALGRAVHSAATGPHLAPVSDPTAIAGREVSMPVSYTPSPPPASSSLWRQGARTFFNDQRANAAGDILTVKISIDDAAELENSTQRNRDGSTDAGVTSLFGKEQALGRLLPPGGTFDPSSLVGATAKSSSTGKGTISRKEKIDLTLAATIAEILPNGNLVVAGRQQVRINGEMRELTVAGVVRPEDIAADNSIRHDQLAEARISYGGAGTLTAVQKPRWGQRVVDSVLPW